jgi:hypothetical protein
MKWSRLTLEIPQGADVYVGLVLCLVAMVFLNVGLVMALRYERRVR